MPDPPIITLTSDWGLKDYYVSSVKGAIYSRLPKAVIVDISHQVRHYDIRQAAFLIRNAYPYFPKDTIHIIDIDSIETSKKQHVLINTQDQYFIGADNGIFNLIFDKNPQGVINIDVLQDSGYFTFPARDRFVKVACDLAKGHGMQSFGNPVDRLIERFNFQPEIAAGKISGKAIYIDGYDNVFTNISLDLFKLHIDKKPFTIPIRAGFNIHKISKAYDEVPEGEILAIFASNGQLQIAMNRGKAASLLGLKIDSSINILFG